MSIGTESYCGKKKMPDVINCVRFKIWLCRSFQHQLQFLVVKIHGNLIMYPTNARLSQLLAWHDWKQPARYVQTCLWKSSSTLYLIGPTWIWVCFSKSTSITSDSNLWVADGRADLSCRRCLTLGKSLTWKKFESGNGKTDSILEGSLADFISTRRCECSSSILFPSTWPLRMVNSGCSNTRKSNPLISSDPTYIDQSENPNQNILTSLWETNQTRWKIPPTSHKQISVCIKHTMFKYTTQSHSCFFR